MHDPAGASVAGEPGRMAIADLNVGDRLRLVVGVGCIVLLAWTYLFLLARDTGDASMAQMAAMSQMAAWRPVDFALMFLMWVVMMVAMMLPSALPMILLYAAVVRRLSPTLPTGALTGAFVSGYVIAWTAFSVAATALQWALEHIALLSPAMVSSSTLLGGLLLVVAGVYQWTPAKDVCLKHCQAPLVFITTHWRPGVGGALRMGVAHGLFCIGCCWAIMGLLFVGGVMNLLWVAAIAVFVLVEKAAPFGRATGRVAGALLVLAGAYVLFEGQLA